MTRFTNLVTRHDSDTVTTKNIPQSDGSVRWSGRYIVRIWMKLYTLKYRHVRIWTKITNTKNRNAGLNSVHWMLLKRVHLKRPNHWHQCWKVHLWRASSFPLYDFTRCKGTQFFNNLHRHQRGGQRIFWLAADDLSTTVVRFYRSFRRGNSNHGCCKKMMNL